jgi:antirestriction protein ArdC
MARKTSSKQDRDQLTRERLHQANDRLATAVAELIGDGDAWTRWLRFQARLHRYSFNNTMLMLAQRPSTSMVAGYQRWRELHRNVRKGEQAMWILAPFTGKRAETDVASGEETEVRYTYFRPVPVFDVAQTDGEPIPTPPQPILLDGSSDELRERFETVAALLTDDGWTVRREQPTVAGANGEADYSVKVVRVRPDVTDAQALKTLVHEWAHVNLGHGDGAGGHRGRREVEAESVAFIVLDGIGVDTSGYSVPYVAGWSEGDPKVVLEVGQRVAAGAGKILGRLEAIDPSRIVHADRALAAA